MKECEISQLQSFRSLLCGALDSTEIMDKMPLDFPINSEQHNNVKAKQTENEAVDALLNELMKIPDSFNRFIEALRDNYELIAKVLTGESDTVDGIAIEAYRQHVNTLFTILLPKLVSVIDAREVSYQLHLKEYLSREDHERVEAKVQNAGNGKGVRLLMYILSRKLKGWKKEFKNIVKRQNYGEEILDILQDVPDDPESFMKMSSSFENSCTSSLASSSVETYEDLSKQENDGVFEDVIFKPAADNNVKLKNCSGEFYKEVEQKKNGTTTPKCSSQYVAKSTPTNSIIPKEVKYSTPLIRSRQPVHGADSLREADRVLTLVPLSGENVILCAPVDTDRCRMVIHIIQSRFQSIHDSVDRKIAFIVSKISKQHNVIKDCVASEQWGVDYFDEDTSVDLSRLMQSSQIVVTTSSAFLSWLTAESDVSKICEFDMLVIDECEFAMAASPIREVLMKFWDAKNAKSCNLPHVIGLANKLVSASARVTKQEDAINYLMDMCALFDAKGGINASADMFQVKSPKKLVKSPAKGRSISGKEVINDPFLFTLCLAIENGLDLLFTFMIGKFKKLRRPLRVCIGTKEYFAWCDDLQSEADLLSNRKQRTDVLQCRAYIYLYNRAFEIKTKYTAQESYEFLNRELNKHHSELTMDEKQSLCAKRLRNDSLKYLSELKAHVDDPRSVNIALNDLGKKIAEIFKKKSTAKALVILNDDLDTVFFQNWFARNGNQSLKIVAESLSGDGSSLDSRKIADFKTGKARRLLITHHKIFREVNVACDILFYDCEQIDTKAKSVKPFTFTPIFVHANAKTKIAKALLVDGAVKLIQRSVNENKDDYLKKLEKRQKHISENYKPFHGRVERM